MESHFWTSPLFVTILDSFPERHSVGIAELEGRWPYHV